MSIKPKISPTYIGRRKCAVALVRFVKGNGDFIINGKTGFNYLQDDPFAIQTVVAPLKLINLEKKYDIVCLVRGGGICAQAEAIQLGIARALCSLTLANIPKTDSLNQRMLPMNPVNPADSKDSKDSKAKQTEDSNKQQLTKSETTFKDSNQSFTEKATDRSVSQGARPLLKQQGYLRRDSRIKERRKYGLKKARKAEQYSKR